MVRSETIRARCVCLVAALVAWSTFIGVADAGGYEIPMGSARALGRGATGFARVDDPIMAMINPAGLASMPNQFMLGTHLVFQKACMDRTGTFDPGYVGGEAGVEHPEVCNGPQPADRLTLLPQLAGVARLGKRVGMGLAIDPPYGSRRMLWEQAVRPAPDGRTRPGFYHAPQGVMTEDDLVPSPVRYMLVKSDVVLLRVQVGFGFKVTDWLQIGAGLAWGFAKLRFTNYTRFAEEGEDPTNEQPIDSTVADWFVPRVVGSIHFIPHDSVDIMVGVRWDDDIKASGTSVAQSPLGNATGSISYRAQQPMWINFGLRYGHRIVPRDGLSQESATDDPMKNETFDIELNLVYERNSVVKDHLFNAGELSLFTDPNDTEPTLTIPAFENPIVVPHRWRDQLSLRLGGDWNVIPGQLSVRLGGSYETRGFRQGYGFLDYLPLQRFGIHTGLSGRFGKVELTVGYAHFFTTAFNDPNGQSPQIVVGLEGPVDGVSTIINSGSYRTHVNVFAWSLRVVFD